MKKKRKDATLRLSDDILAELSFISESLEENDTPKEETVFNEDNLPILPLRNMILFPNTVMPVAIGRQSSRKLIKEVQKNNGFMGVFCQKVASTENPLLSDLYQIGAAAKIIKVLNMPDKSMTVILQGLHKIELKEIVGTYPYLTGNTISTPDIEEPDDDEYKQLLFMCNKSAKQLFTMNNEQQPDTMFTLNNADLDASMINFLCSNSKTSIAERMELMKINSIKERAYMLLRIMDREMQFSEIRNRIAERTHTDIDQQQKEYYLQQQMKNIQEELGGNIQDQDADTLREKADTKNWSQETEELFSKELLKLSRINPQSPDYHVQLNYLQLFVNMPWGECTKDNLDINNARKILDRDHYGLDKVKERILEHLAVIKMRGDLKSPILCLYGPPGVGKTSLGKSIAEALKRKYVRMSLGGIHDESEIRGHRRTYIGAMPGRILKNLVKAGSDNPVFILDEIDKVGGISNHGDPSSALLEVLDPEQNNAFHDNFLDTDYDLSKVMFIATANNLATIPAPLLDRMELIEVSGYLTEEKIEIAKRHLVPKEKEANGIADEKINISKPAIEKIIEEYTRESGVRTLEKKIGKICRKLACQKAIDGEIKTRDIKPAHLVELLGVREFSRDKYQGNDYAGVVTGLAWTAVGGEILFIETSLSHGKGEKLTLTGNLGDVMKESALLALEYIKSHAAELDIPTEVFDKWNIHLHVPEGAIPKDGPSAGITMATALASALTQRKVKQHIAMTGEITLRGKVLPVGGIKEKILAAKRAGITEIIICEENRRNIEAIPEMYIKGLTFHYVNDIKEVLDIALLDEKVMNPINLLA